MSSLIEGYNYDIFISYRQKDNKGDRWVSEFVEALKTELESTFKEEISVYFDINPYDGLLETHDVDESLKEKLKCLVFIPIISRTYCDPKSFAWEHEFKAFVELASKDRFGWKVKLPNGNVASRVLPIRIHNLDSNDIILCESIIGGVLRGVEFIYKEPGVNKPLAIEDDEKKNLNITKYRIQINKVANAIKEIISGLETELALVVKENDQLEVPFMAVREDERKEEAKKSVKSFKHRWLFVAAFAAMLFIVVIIAYPKIFSQDKVEYLRSKGEISVAVMPFQNMTNDTLWNVWQEGIQNELIINLTNSEELKVRQTQTINGLIQSQGLINYASITPTIARNISQKLDANVFIYGSLKRAGSTIRLNAQLIDSETEEVFKTFQIEDKAEEEKIFRIIDSLSVMVKNFLIITVLEKAVTQDFRSIYSTNSSEAYRCQINGTNAFSKVDYSTARNWYLRALAIDSNLVIANIMIAVTYGNQSNFTEAKKRVLKVYEERDQLSMMQKAWVNWAYAHYFGETPSEEIRFLRENLDIDDQQPTWYNQLGLTYSRIYEFNKAISEFEKSLEIYNKWNIKPMWPLTYTNLAYAYHKTGEYNKEKKLLQKADLDFPDNPSIVSRQTILALSEGKTNKANEYLEKYISIRKENSASEAAIATSLGYIYEDAGIMDKAEIYYREALSLEADNPIRLNNLAYFLIDQDRNINEGLELVDKALILSPDEYEYLDTKGWGLYKQGKFQEALEVLQKSWDIRREMAVYDHEAFLRLEAARKAVASQKNN